MTVYTASLLLTIQRRSDWDQPHLNYVPKRYYRSGVLRAGGALARALREMVQRRSAA